MADGCCRHSCDGCHEENIVLFASATAVSVQDCVCSGTPAEPCPYRRNCPVFNGPLSARAGDALLRMPPDLPPKESLMDLHS